jgi:hypothetical protein
MTSERLSRRYGQPVLVVPVWLRLKNAVADGRGKLLPEVQLRFPIEAEDKFLPAINVYRNFRDLPKEYRRNF